MVVSGHRTENSAIANGKHIKEKKKRKTKRNGDVANRPQKLTKREEVHRWFYQGASRRSIYAWNRLLILSFIKGNRICFKEGMLYEDYLWTYHLMQHLSNVAFVYAVTYIYYKRNNSLSTTVKREEKASHLGCFYREIADDVAYGGI